MATADLQHIHHLGCHLGFFKNFNFNKTAANFLELILVENMFLLPQIGIRLRIEWKRIN